MSTAIANIQYDPKTLVLVVSFVKGGSHVYSPVSPETVAEFREAGSQGQFFNQVIRPMDPGRVRGARQIGKHGRLLPHRHAKTGRFVKSR